MPSGILLVTNYVFSTFKIRAPHTCYLAALLIIEKESMSTGLINAFKMAISLMRGFHPNDPKRDETLNCTCLKTSTPDKKGMVFIQQKKRIERKKE